MVSQQMYALGSQPSAIRELFAFGRQRAAEIGEERVFDFSIGNPSIPTPDALNQALARLALSQPTLAVHGYTPAAGDSRARENIADDLNQRFQTSFGPGDLFLTCGAAPALVAVMHALTEAGEGNEFIVSAPFFPEYRVFVEGAGAKLKVLPAQTEDFQIDLIALAAAINPKTRALIVNSPNNPSGVIYSAETIRALADLLIAKATEIGHPIYIISDEPYRELAFHGRAVPFIPHYYDDTLICYSYSKSLSLPGERIGYVLVNPAAAAAPRLYLAVAGAARLLGHICAPALFQQAVGQCAGLRPDVSVYERNADLLYTQMNAWGYRTAKPEGAFYLFFQAPHGLSGAAFSAQARDRCNVLLVPGDSFGCPDWLRLSFCVDTRKVEGALPLLEQLIKAV